MVPGKCCERFDGRIGNIDSRAVAPNDAGRRGTAAAQRKKMSALEAASTGFMTWLKINRRYARGIVLCSLM